MTLVNFNVGSALGAAALTSASAGGVSTRVRSGS